MKNIFVVLIFTSLVVSCEKEKEKKCDNLTYYSEDYKSKEVNILGVSSSTIDALWVEFYSKESKDYTHYSLIVKSDGEFVKENGTCTIDWEQKISFLPDSGSSYEGTWLSDKEKYTVTISEDGRGNELTFVYKDANNCGCGKK